jgi:hypothetical protein
MPAALLKMGLKVVGQDDSNSAINSSLANFEKLGRAASRNKKIFSELKTVLGSGFGSNIGTFMGGYIGGSRGMDGSEVSTVQNEVREFSNSLGAGKQDIVESKAKKEMGEFARMAATYGGAYLGERAGEKIGKEINKAISKRFSGFSSKFLGRMIGRLSGPVGALLGATYGEELFESIGELADSVFEKRKYPGRTTFDIENMSFLQMQKYRESELNIEKNLRYRGVMENTMNQINDYINSAIYGTTFVDEEIQKINRNYEEGKMRRQKEYDLYRSNSMEALEYFQRN